MVSHTDSFRRLVPKMLSFTVVGCSLFFLALYVGIAGSRLFYPFELEWLEGLSLQHVKRVMGEGALYVRPTIDFVPNIYPPLHAYVGAFVCTIFGASFTTLRALSFVSSIGIIVLIHRFVARETSTPSSIVNVPATFAAGLFIATFDRVGGWLDIARIDSFFIFLVLAATYTARFYPTPRGFALAALGFVAAGFVKQSGFVVVIPLMFALIYCYGLRGVWFSVVLGSVAALSTLALAFLYEGSWFFYYVIDMPLRHPKVALSPMDIVWKDLLAPMPVACLLAAVALLPNDYAAPRHRQIVLGAFLVGGFWVSWMVRSRVGTFLNDIIPAYVALAVVAGVGVDRCLRHIEERALPSSINAPVCVLVLIQFWLLRYDPLVHIPTAEDRTAGESIVQQLREIPGEVFLPHHGYLAEMAGKRSFAHTLAVDNIRAEDRGPNREFLERQMLDALSQKRFSAVIVESDGWGQASIREYYRPLRSLYTQSGVFFPREGGKIRPEVIFIPR